ncbi:MAG TPA: helix-turn-helix transcriptional regulator [Acidimicrobiales bacterium]|jgi:transcriptional regulator with XRE-family HTH domain
MYGAFLRQVRQSRGLSQAQLGEIAGIKQANVSAYENDRRLPSIDIVNRILVGCGYLLAAGDITCPLPKVGWFPDDDLPPAEPDDPPESGDPLPYDTPIDERIKMIRAVLNTGTGARP